MNALNIELTAPTVNIVTNKDGWNAKTYWNLPENHRLKFSTYKDSSGYLTTTCCVCKYEETPTHTSEQFLVGVAGEGDMYYKLIRSKIRCTEAAVKRQHELALRDHFETMVANCFNMYKEKMKLEGELINTLAPTSTAQLAQSVIQGAMSSSDPNPQNIPKATPTADPAKPRTIREIALEIKRLWQKPYFGAVPYLNAMLTVNGPNDPHGVEDGRTQVLYFLGNAQQFRGEDAKRIKAELKKLCNIK